MRIKIISAVLLVAVLGFLPLSGLFSSSSRPKFLEGENRLRAKAPQVSLLEPVRSYKDFKLFFNDNYRFRDQLVWLGSNIKVNVWGVSPDPRAYFIGRRGWVFYSATVGENRSTMDEYRGLMPLSQEHLTKTRKSFEQMDWLVKKNDGVFYAAYIPNKQTVYPEYLPAHFSNHQPIVENRQLNQFYKIMSGSSVPLIDLESELLRCKDNYQGLLYNPRTDYSHWNMRGAYIAYKKVIDTVRQDFKDIPLVRYEDLEFEVAEELAKRDFPLFAGFFNWYGRELVPETVHFIRRQPKSDRKVLVLGDSFGRNIAPYFQETFSNISFYRARYFSPKTLEEEKPEIVIRLRSARYVRPIIYEEESLTMPLKLDSFLDDLLEGF